MSFVGVQTQFFLIMRFDNLNKILMELLHLFHAIPSHIPELPIVRNARHSAEPIAMAMIGFEIL